MSWPKSKRRRANDGAPLLLPSSQAAMTSQGGRCRHRFASSTPWWIVPASSKGLPTRTEGTLLRVMWPVSTRGRPMMAPAGLPSRLLKFLPSPGFSSQLPQQTPAASSQTRTQRGEAANSRTLTLRLSRLLRCPRPRLPSPSLAPSSRSASRRRV